MVYKKHISDIRVHNLADNTMFTFHCEMFKCIWKCKPRVIWKWKLIIWITRTPTYQYYLLIIIVIGELNLNCHLLSLTIMTWSQFIKRIDVTAHFSLLIIRHYQNSAQN